MKKIGKLIGIIALFIGAQSAYAQLGLMTDAIDVSCNGQNDGMAMVQAAGGMSPYTYIWSNGQTTALITGLAAGYYTVTVQDAQTIVNVADAIINEPEFLYVYTDKGDVSCAYNCDGYVYADAYGGVSPYTYQWGAGTGYQTTREVWALCAGTYTVTVTDANTCIQILVQDIYEPAALSLNVSSTSVTCGSFCDGTASVTISGGVAPSTFQWSASANLQTGSTANNLCPGVHAVTATDANGCSIVENVTIEEPTPIVVSSTVTNATCNQADGAIDIYVFGGASGYVYSWSNGSNSQDINNLTAGAYHYAIIDANSCIVVDSIVVGDNSPDVVLSVTDADCAQSNGSISTTVSGGSAPYLYQWSNGQSTTVVTGLTSGTYTLTVTDNAGCVVVNQATLLDMNGPEITYLSHGDVSCAGLADGFISISVTPGQPIEWFNESNQELIQFRNEANIYGLPGNMIYTAQTTDNNGCVGEFSLFIYEPEFLDVGFSSVQYASDNLANGSVQAVASGGTPPYTYYWSDGQTTSLATGLAASSYTVAVNDANGCFFESNPIIIQDLGCIEAAFDVAEGTCGQCDGSVTVNVNKNCEYLLNMVDVFGDGWNGGSLNVTLDGQSYGDFWVGMAGPQDVETIVVHVYSGQALELNYTPGNWEEENHYALLDAYGDSIFFDGPNPVPGQVFVSTVSCPSDDYAYVWSNGSTTKDQTGLCAGNYSVSIDGANNCFYQETFNVNPSTLDINVSVTDASCGSSDGEALVAVQGGTTPFTYQWSHNMETTETVSGLSFGNYSVTVSDNDACSSETAFVVQATGSLSVSTSATAVTCFGMNDGTINVDVMNGSTPYSYLWTNTETTSTITGLNAGTYQVTITDQSGCAVLTSGTISEPQQLIYTSNITDETCLDNANGTIELIASGGLGSYLYSINNGSSWSMINTFTGLSSGTYSLIVVDANGCEAAGAVTLTPGTELSVTSIATDPYGCSSWGSIQMQLNSGVTPYTYTWDNEPAYEYLYTNSNFSYVSPGDYTITVSDDSGCETIVNESIGASCPDNQITGYVYADLNNNCVDDNDDYHMPYYIIRVQPGNQTYYTDYNGYFNFYLPEGDYTVTVQPGFNSNGAFFDLACPASGQYEISLGSTPEAVNINFGYSPLVGCSQMQVDVSAWGIRPCFDNYYWIEYQNVGATPSFNTILELEIDSTLMLTYASETIAQQEGNTYYFDVGTVYPGQYGYIIMTMFLECDMNLLGATKCVRVSANDSLCEPIDENWDRSSIVVEGYCDGNGNACFSVSNTGDAGDGDMQGTTDWRLYENNQLIQQGTIQLNGQESEVLCFASNSNTIRLEVDQRPGHPGNSHPRADVEMCGDPDYVMGQILSVPLDDDDINVSIECIEVTSSYDPNEKNVLPRGITEEYHYIDSLVELEYTIHFQNTGNDTAFNVFVYDTLTEYLDVATIQPGISSHPYRMNYYNNRVIEWVFSDIMLVDSTTNEPLSHGFVKFKINQTPGNPKGTVIENSVGIVFDFNEPIITNTAFNTVGIPDTFRTISVVPELLDKTVEVLAYPNPFNESITIEVGGGYNQLELELVDIQGKQHRKQVTNNNKFVVQREDLASGVYFYTVYNKSGVIGRGKLVVE